MNRRSFMQSVLAAGVAPWVMDASSLMLMPRRELIVPAGLGFESLGEVEIAPLMPTLRIFEGGVNFGGKLLAEFPVNIDMRFNNSARDFVRITGGGKVEQNGCYDYYVLADEAGTLMCSGAASDLQLTRSLRVGDTINVRDSWVVDDWFPAVMGVK